MNANVAMAALVAGAILPLPAAARPAADAAFWAPGLAGLKWGMPLDQAEKSVGAGKIFDAANMVTLIKLATPYKGCKIDYRLSFARDRLSSVNAVMPAEGCAVDFRAELGDHYGAPETLGRGSQWDGSTVIYLQLPPLDGSGAISIQISDGTSPRRPAD
jgi:hypothetical protein